MISSLLYSLNQLHPELVLFALFVMGSLFLLGFAHFFGKSGLYVYSVLALVMANIQVLKGVSFSFWSEPVALGTLLFSSTFIVSDVLTECFGAKTARMNVGLGFLSSLMVTCLMLLTLGLRPVEVDSLNGQAFLQAHSAMAVLFKPSLAIFGASLFSYIISQLLDIFVFQKLKDTFPTWALWRRSVLSTALAFLADNILFSSLAWVLFAENPVGLDSLIWTYILGTYVLRLAAAVLSLPLVTLVKKLVKHDSLS